MRFFIFKKVNNNIKYTNEKENSIYEEKIVEINQILKNNLENKEKEKCENKINSFKKEKENIKNKLTEIDKEINDIEKYKKENISNPINQNIFELLNKYSQLEIEKFVNSFNFSETENILKWKNKNRISY